jgi:hypothetical protein
MKDLLMILDAMLAKKSEVRDQRELLLDVGDRVVKTISGLFGTRADEVAVLLLTSDGRHLRFIAPRPFIDLGTIPITKRDSIAVSVLSKKAGEAMNNVPLVRHVAFFETVKVKERAAPIQKMITVPIMLAGAPVGVAQISRKGESPAAAGPDFNPGDVRKAQEIFEQLAARLAAARPERF